MMARRAGLGRSCHPARGGGPRIRPACRPRRGHAAAAARPAATLAAVALALAVAAAGGAAWDGSGHAPDALPLHEAHAQSGSAPTVVNVTSTMPDGVYGAGRAINVTVEFTERVVWHSSDPQPPRLALDMGGEERLASYASGNGTTSLVFNYTVRAGDTEDDLDYRGAGALTGGIKDTSGNNASLALPVPGTAGSLGDLSDILVDHAAPVLVADASIGGMDSRSPGNLRPIDAFYVEDKAYALAGGLYGDLNLYRVQENGSFAETDHVDFRIDRTSIGLGSFSKLYYIWDVVAFYLNGSAHAIVTSARDTGNNANANALNLVRVHGNGTLEARTKLIDAVQGGEHAFRGPRGIDVFDLNGSLHALVAGDRESSVQLIRIHDNGTMEARSHLNDTHTGLTTSGRYSSYAYESNTVDVDTFAMDGKMYAVAASQGADLIYLLQIADNGTLVYKRDMGWNLTDNDELALTSPFDVQTFYLDGRPHALITTDVWDGGTNADTDTNDGVQLVRVHSNGTLQGVDSLSDGDGGMALANARRASVFNGSDGGTYAVVAAHADDSLNLIRVRGDGALLPAGSVGTGDTGFARLDEATGVDTFELGGITRVMSGTYAGNIAVVSARLSAASVTNVTAAAGTYGPGDALDISVVFDRPVAAEGPLELALDSGAKAAYESGSGSKTLVFQYKIGADDPDADDLNYDGIHALRAGPGGSITVPGEAGKHASAALPPPGSPRSLGGSAEIAVRTDPSVLSVSSPNSGVHGFGDLVRIEVNYDVKVNVTGAASLELDLSQTDRSAAYERGSGTDTLVFNYTVQAGDKAGDLSYAGAGALSGNITDVLGNAANTTLPAAARLSESGPLVIDHAAPALIPRNAAVQGSSGFSKLDVARDVKAIEIDGAQYLVAGGATGAQSIRVHEDGRLSPAGSLSDDGSTVLLDTVESIDVFKNSTGTAYAIAAAHLSYALQTMHVHEGGSLAAVEALEDGGDRELNRPYDVAAFKLGAENHTYALATSNRDDNVQLVRVHENGTMDAIATGPDVSDRPIGVDVFKAADGTARALVAESAGDRVNLFRVNETAVIHLGSANDSATDPASVLDGPWSVTSFDLDGERHALVAGNEDGLQLLRVEDGSSLVPAGWARHGQGGFDALDNGRRIATFTAGGATYGIVVTETGLGIQLVRVDGGGGEDALVPAGSAFGSDPGFVGSRGYYGVDTFELGGKTYAAVASGRYHWLSPQGSVQVIQLLRASVDSVNSTDGTHVAGSTVRASVNFNDNVTYSGADPPVLVLNVSGSTREAAYERGSGTPTLVFNYTVVQGDNTADLAYHGVAALRGDIRDLNGNPADPTLPAPGSAASLSGLSSVVIDTNGPLALSVSSPNSTGPHGIGKTVRIAVQFDEGIEVNATLGAPALAMSTGGSAVYVPAAQPGSRMLFDYTVGEGDWSERLDYAGVDALSLNGAVVMDELGNGRSPVLLPRPGEGSLAGASNVAVDGVRPAVESVSSPNSAGTYGIGDTILVNVTFDEQVLVAGGPLLALDMGGANRTAEYASGSGTASLLFSYTVAAGDMSGGLDYAGRSALSLGPGGSIADAAGNAARLALPAPPGGSGSLGGAGLAVDGTRPADAAASAAFVGPNTVRIDYTAPLGPPEGHEGPVYGSVTVSGAAAADPAGESGLGTQAHTVRFGGDGAARDRAGTIALLADLVGEAGGIQYGFDDDVIQVRPGSEARRLAPPAAAPVVAIEADGYVREVDSTAAGAAACPSINVTSLVSDSGSVSMPGERVGMIASFAEVWFPPGVGAEPAPAGGLLGLCVSQQPPSALDIAAGLGEADAAGLEVLTIVEIGDSGKPVWFTEPVRIVLAGQANASAFYVNVTSGAVVPIPECAEDDAGAPVLPSGESECHADSADGRDTTIYTRHLTQFGAARAADGAAMCSATLGKPDIKFGRVEAGAQISSMSQVLKSAGTLGIDEVSVTATAWADGAGRTVMPAAATRVLSGTAGWLPLGAEAVDLRAGGADTVAVNFSLAVPPGALAEGVPSIQASQSVTYAVSCVLQPG